MNRTTSRAALAVALAVVLAALPQAAAAQSVWLEPVQGSAVRAEFHRPEFDNPYFDTSTMSGIWTLSTTFLAKPEYHVHIEVPYARFSVEGNYSTDASSTTLGNLYAGFVHRNPGSSFRVLAGGRLPTTADSEIATFMAQSADFVDRFEAFAPHITSLHLATEYRPERTDGFGLRARVEPLIWIDMGDDTVLQDGFEIWVAYHLAAALTSGQVSVGAGFSGRWLFTEDGEDFDDRNFNEAGIFLNLEIGDWTPTARLQIPVDEEIDEMLNPSLVIGIGRNVQ